MKKVTALSVRTEVIVSPSLILREPRSTQLAISITNPYGVALDPISGSLYVANNGANTVLKYSV